MKRDWDLIRRILIKIEEKPTTSGVIHPEAFPEQDPSMVSYHFHMLKDAGLIDAVCQSCQGNILCLARNLTWTGHEFLDTIRSDTAWNRIVSTVKGKGFDLTFDAIKSAGASLLTTMMGS